MAKEKDNFYLNFWYMALASPFGVELITSDAESCRAKLYGVRKEAQDSDLEGIAICTSPFDAHRLWLVKRNPGNAPT